MRFVTGLICLLIAAANCQRVLGANQISVRIPRQINDRCQLPPHPIFGQWAIYEQDFHHPGEFVPSGTILQVSCRNGYKLEGDGTVACIKGDWSRPIGQCLKTCPSIHSTPILTVTCTYNEKRLENCTDAVTGTKAQFQCADFHEDQKLERNPVAVCYDGKWSNRKPECTPICGKKSPKSDPKLIVAGKNVTRGEYPWQVALYNVSDKELLCGGSLLNQRVILTAAHCITNVDGKLLPDELYIVAVGKYYRKYDDPRDSDEAQFSQILKMFIPRNYKGDIQNYFGDIGIIITKKTFELSIRVQPVCVDWGLKHFPDLLDPTKIQHGYVTGWGFTVEYKNPSNVLKELKVPILYEEDCRNKITQDYEKYLTDDKLCAGFLDSGRSVCKGDSGGGLVTQYGNRYYIVAIVSLSPQAPTPEGGCDSNQVTLLTRVAYYINNFILEKEAQFRPSLTEEVPCKNNPNCTAVSTTTKPLLLKIDNKNCELPGESFSGKWSVLGDNGTLTRPVFGTLVPIGTILQVSCDQGFELNGNEQSVCQNGKWRPEIAQCLKSCPPITSTQTTQITCFFKNTEIDCSNPFDGAIAKHTCADFYEDLQLSTNPVRVCRNGTWDLSTPECVPICGRKGVSVQPLIVNGNVAKKNEFPWHVGIYQGRRKNFLCGGTLISPRLILTAAHCVRAASGTLQDINNYTVGMGAISRGFYNFFDDGYQSSELEDIFIPAQYSENKTLFADIAILVTKQPFILSRSVQPICVDWTVNYMNETIPKNVTGYVTGWGYVTPNANQAGTLRFLKVPIVTDENCTKVLPNDSLPFLTSDKFCAGYVNSNKSVCRGDAGGGLITRYEDRYYITGVLSYSPSVGDGCDTETYALYTKVSSYIEFILEKQTQTKSSSSTDPNCNDEDKICTVTPKPASVPEELIGRSCRLPQHPAFGKWVIMGTPYNYPPGTSMVPGTVLQILCYNKYSLRGDSVIFCENGKWSSEIGQCLKTCPPVQRDPNLKATCTIKGKESNCSEPVDGTLVKYECAPWYENMELARDPIHVCQDGAWNRRPPRCVPVCGQKSVTPQLLIINGKTTKRGDYPWHVAIYFGTEKQFVCSGTLISQKLILTAARCVTDSNGELLSKNNFTIAVGKFYQNSRDPREDNTTVQFSGLLEMFVHPLYKGSHRNYLANIAVLVTEKLITLSPNVQPICVDLEKKFDNEFLKKYLVGYVAGWGYTTEAGNSSDKLQELQVPILEDEKCRDEIGQRFGSYFTYDKICAGYINEGKSLCRGDTGGALAVKFENKFYIAGIAAMIPAKHGSCDSQHVSLYTKISSHIDRFILKKLLSYKS